MANDARTKFFPGYANCSVQYCSREINLFFKIFCSGLEVQYSTYEWLISKRIYLHLKICALPVPFTRPAMKVVSFSFFYAYLNKLNALISRKNHLVLCWRDRCHSRFGDAMQSSPARLYLIPYSAHIRSKVSKRVETLKIERWQISRHPKLNAQPGEHNMYAVYAWPLRKLLQQQCSCI